jgi:hypothetical protein
MMTRKFKFISFVLGVLVTLTTTSFAQTARTVMVQSNSGVLLFPTNLWSANANAARAGLSLAAHATNPVVPLANGGSGATNAAAARTNYGLAWSGLTNADAASFRSALGLGTAATNAAVAFQPSSLALSNLTAGNGSALTNLSVSNVTGLQVTLDSKLATNGSAAGLTNFPANVLATNGSAAGLTNFPANVLVTNGSAAGLTNFPAVLLRTNGNAGGLTNLQASALVGVIPATNISSVNFSNLSGTLLISSGGTGATNAFGARSNLGLPLAALTNVDNASFLTALFGAGTNAVLVDSNGVVVSPTNFWQTGLPPIVLYQEAVAASNSVVAVSNSRIAQFYSLLPTITGITNTIQLPTNGVATGDQVTVVHRGGANTLTAVRSENSTNNLLAMTNSNEAVLFIYREGAWRLGDNLWQAGPLSFAGTNASANIAVTRSNLGLGTGMTASFSNVTLAGYQGVGAVLVGFDSSGTMFRHSNISTVVGVTNMLGNIAGVVTNWSLGQTRTNLGLGWSALTNTDATNFQAAVFTTNTAPTNTTNVVGWTTLRIGTNTFRVPLYQ